MAVLKAYVDESGDEDPRHAALSVAGYIATVEVWDRFEAAWRWVLDKFEVPYLHMKEFKERHGAFKGWPISKEKDSDFLARLAGTIDPGMRAFGAVVVIDDLKQFNNEHKLGIDAKAFAIYASTMELRLAQPKECVEVILDRMTKPHPAIGKAQVYGQFTDLSFHPLLERGQNSSRNTPALQAADFLAWEIRKDYELKKLWYQANPDGCYHILSSSNNDGTKTFRALFKRLVEDRRAHIKDREEESIDIPYEPHRRSLIALDSAATINAHIWNYHMMKQLHEIKGGDWGA